MPLGRWSLEEESVNTTDSSSIHTSSSSFSANTEYGFFSACFAFSVCSFRQLQVENTEDYLHSNKQLQVANTEFKEKEKSRTYKLKNYTRLLRENYVLKHKVRKIYK